MFRGNNFARQEKERVRERLYNQIGGVCVMMEMMVGELQEHPKRYCSIQYKNLLTVVVFSMCTKWEKERERENNNIQPTAGIHSIAVSPLSGNGAGGHGVCCVGGGGSIT